MPVHLRSLVEPSPNGGKMPKMGPRKRDNYFKDLARWARFTGVELTPKARDLMKTDARPPLRVAMVAQEMGRFSDFHDRAYRARWCEGRDLSRHEVLADLLTQGGLDAETVLARAETDEIQQQLDARTQEAIGRGVFGVPVIFVGDEMFWGNDRFELVRSYIEELRHA